MQEFDNQDAQATYPAGSHMVGGDSNSKDKRSTITNLSDDYWVEKPKQVSQA
jgi:hypothetical protein